MSDYHLHLHPHAGGAEYSGAPQGEYPAGHLEAYVEQAAARGADEIGFTEHLYRCHEAAPVLGRFWEDDRTPDDLASLTQKMVETDLTLSLEDYAAEVIAAKERGLPVKLGLEIDFFPDTIDAVLELVEPYPWDYLIGSVHWVGGWTVDASHSIFEFDRRGVNQAWSDYFALEAQLAGSGAVDVLAHVDVIKKYGFRPRVDPSPWYRAVVDAAAVSSTAVEVSSQGLRYAAAEVYPAAPLLARFQEAGVPITLASDGHTPDQAAWGHTEVVAAAAAAGYTTHLRFDTRRSIPVPL